MENFVLDMNMEQFEILTGLQILEVICLVGQPFKSSFPQTYERILYQKGTLVNSNVLTCHK